MTSVCDNGFCMSPPSPSSSSAMTGGSKENYLYSPSHVDFFLPFPKKRQDEVGKNIIVHCSTLTKHISGLSGILYETEETRDLG